MARHVLPTDTDKRVSDRRRWVHNGKAGGISAPGKVLNTDYLFELAAPTYLVSIDASLTPSTMTGLSAQAAAGKLAGWAISQQP